MTPDIKSKYVALMAIDQPMTRDEFATKFGSFYQSDLHQRKISLIQNKISDDFKRAPDIDLLKDKLPVKVLEKYRDEFFWSRDRNVVHIVSASPNEKEALDAIATALANGSLVEPAEKTLSEAGGSSTKEPVKSSSSYWLGVVNSVVKTVKPYLSENLQTYLPNAGEGFKDDDEMIAYVRKWGIQTKNIDEKK